MCTKMIDYYTISLMQRIIFFLLLITLSLFIYSSSPSSASAATLRSGERVVLPATEHLENVYSFGQNIITNALITGDLVTAGGNLALHGAATGSIMGAGGDVVIDSKVGNSIRVAGGNITISGPVSKDVVVAGGTVTIEKSASIGGDLLFTGGTLQVNGPIKGKIIMNGGTVILASTVGGNVEGNVGTLSLQNGAEIKGDLSYSSSQKALISDGAIVHGQEIYHATPKNDKEKGLGRFIAKGLFYKLITDILFALLLVYLFPGIIMKVGQVARSRTLKSGLVGVGFISFCPPGKYIPPN